MKEFIEDNFDRIIMIILIIIALIVSTKYINNINEERIAIINNKKENVIKYENCEKIEDYYYCWNK